MNNISWDPLGTRPQMEEVKRFLRNEEPEFVEFANRRLNFFDNGQIEEWLYERSKDSSSDRRLLSLQTCSQRFIYQNENKNLTKLLCSDVNGLEGEWRPIEPPNLSSYHKSTYVNYEKSQVFQTQSRLGELEKKIYAATTLIHNKEVIDVEIENLDVKTPDLLGVAAPVYNGEQFPGILTSYEEGMTYEDVVKNFKPEKRRELEYHPEEAAERISILNERNIVSAAPGDYYEGRPIDFIYDEEADYWIITDLGELDPESSNREFIRDNEIVDKANYYFSDICPRTIV
ncbi:MAG: hypothetical protein ABEJ93_05260 [Candidatus Nanohalobium sp.]